MGISCGDFLELRSSVLISPLPTSWIFLGNCNCDNSSVFGDTAHRYAGAGGGGRWHQVHCYCYHHLPPDSTIGAHARGASRARALLRPGASFAPGSDVTYRCYLVVCFKRQTPLHLAHLRPRSKPVGEAELGLAGVPLLRRFRSVTGVAVPHPYLVPRLDPQVGGRRQESHARRLLVRCCCCR